MAAARIPVTVYFQPHHLARLRACVREMQALGHKRVSLAGMIDTGTVVISQRLEAAHNEGQRWPTVEGPLPSGRRPR